MSAGFSARYDKNIDAGLGMFDGMFLGAGQRANRNLLGAGAFHHRIRRHAQRIDDQLDRVREGNVENFGRTGKAQMIAKIIGDLPIP